MLEKNLKLRGSDDNGYALTESYGVYDSNGVMMSSATAITLKTRYSGKWLNTLAIGGVGTEPLYRREGCVRMFIEHLFSQAQQRGWAVGILHPFSFAYYRKFGYEKVSEHRTVSFPISAISYIPRCNELRKMKDSDILSDVLSVFDEFSKGRNLFIERYDGRNFGGNVYVYYENGKPTGYIKLEGENYYSVNRMISVALHIRELVYLNRNSLISLLGFVRMFEGEFDKVIIHDVAPLPEVDMVLKNYFHTEYTITPDLALRVFDTAAVLRANSYPEETGRFTLKVNDILPLCAGTYTVEYGKGECNVERHDGAEYDISLSAQSLSQLLYGYDMYTPDNIVYLDGVELKNKSCDIFRAYPKRVNGLFEHF